MSNWLKQLAASLTILASVSGCATSSPAPTSDFCLIAEPIRLLDSEWAALSEQSVEAILRHDAAGEKLCGW